MEKASFPFVFGVAAGACVAGGASYAPPYAAALSLLACCVIMTMICTTERNGYLLPLLFVALGLFCSISASLSLGRAGQMPLFAKAADSFKRLIAAIPYRKERTGALVCALLTGDKSSLGRDITDTFRRSGASHILALSGLHLGFIYLAAKKATALIGNSPGARILRCATTISFCVFYTAMTGAAPSTQRACIFIILKELSDISQQRRSSTLRSLHTALVLQLAISPWQIRDVGFQLSYLAMAGILYLNPLLQRWFPADASKWNPAKHIWNSAALSISCQAFTAPAAWHYFGTFPKYFLLTNLFSLPLTSAVMALSVGTIVLSGIGICPEFMIILNEKAIDLLLFVLKVISEI